MPEPTWMDRLLANMDKWQASDLFVSEGKVPAVRIHGRIRSLKGEPVVRQAIQDWLEMHLPEEQRRRFEETGDLDAGHASTDGNRFRLNLSRTQGRLAVVVRSLASGAMTFDELGLPETVQKLAELPRGMVLVTGATGAGKSTTLAAMVHHINQTRPGHIVTIEDPIEFVHQDLKGRVSQREIGADTPTFAHALKHVLRQSPDAILIGELRDKETITVALQAAMTGHLILGSLHTIDAPQTIQRILSYYPEHLQDEIAVDLSSCLEGIVAQRLIPAKDGGRRLLATEILRRTPPSARLLKEMRFDDLADFMKTTSDPNVQTFNQSLIQLYEDDQIDFETGKAYATSPDEFILHARGLRSGIETVQTQTAATHEVDIKGLLGQAMQRGASDLHLAVGRPPILRIAGKLTPLEMNPLGTADLRSLLYSIMSQRQRTTFELERELDFALAFDNGQRFRVNAYYQKGAVACALRAIPSTIPQPENLRIPDVVIELGDRPHGLLLVVGPTGAGKTTTLACLIDRINSTRGCRIITVEDPIEYVHESKVATVDQREVGADTKTFAAALKYILRQDPDVILVGEMRDYETVSAALAAAETGHLVLATLHSNDAIQTIDRIVDVFPPHQQPQARSQLAASLVAVVSQRLLPKADDPEKRVPAVEVMVANPAIRNLIRDNKMHQAHSIMETSKIDGMVTMDTSMKRLYEAKEITYDTALRYVVNPRSLGPKPM